MDLRELIRRKKFFYIPVLIFIITGIIFLSLYQRDHIHLTHNAWHWPWADHFFSWITILGDGMIFPLIALVLAFVKWRYFIGFLMASLLTLLLVGFLKQVVFKENPRPAHYFKERAELYLVEGVEIHHNNSFPSGHTTFAFAAWGFLALVARRRRWQFLFFIIAALVGYSRMYLSQHFLADVIAGSFIGTILATFAYLIMQRLKKEWSDKQLKFPTFRP